MVHKARRRGNPFITGSTVCAVVGGMAAIDDTVRAAVVGLLSGDRAGELSAVGVNAQG